jgi:hypothetical protein
MDAEQQVNISAAPLIDESSEINSATVDYFGWLGLVREKYIDHLTDYIEEYPILMKRLGILVGKNDRDTLRDMMAQVYGTLLVCAIQNSLPRVLPSCY